MSSLLPGVATTIVLSSLAGAQESTPIHPPAEWQLPWLLDQSSLGADWRLDRKRLPNDEDRTFVLGNGSISAPCRNLEPASRLTLHTNSGRPESMTVIDL
ncbi:MAG: hypothetical protein ACYTG5_17695, partial [Planctomycetota bacterium]